jgi:hypothetical protein
MACESQLVEIRKFMTGTDLYRHRLTMPIQIDKLNDGPVPIQPGTNEEAALSSLAAHPDLGFAPEELRERTDIPSGSIHKTLQRLVEKGLARKTDTGYYYVAPDRDVRGLLQSIRALENLSREFEGDWFDRNPDWATDLPDLGTETVDTRQRETSLEESFSTDDLPDLGTESTEESDS